MHIHQKNILHKVIRGRKFHFTMTDLHQFNYFVRELLLTL